MTNLGGHDLETILEAFDAAAADPTPHDFVAYTIKGHGLPLAGHKDNHAGLMNPGQLKTFQALCGVPEGEEWEPYAGLSKTDAEAVRRFLPAVPLLGDASPSRRPAKWRSPRSPRLPARRSPPRRASARSCSSWRGRARRLAERIVTTSPDVTVSTNLSGWVNRRGVFHSSERADTFSDEKVASPQKWRMAPAGQHIELGIAEHNLFLLLGQLGLADRFWGERLLPVGTVYDPFINRGLDALIYACYQGARFMIVATPSGITLAPEGGAHQSINTPLIGMAQDGLSYFEPAYADELAVIMTHGFEHMQADNGGSIYLRLSTRQLDQLPREMTPELQEQVIAGGYWLRAPHANTALAIAYCGAVAPEALEATHRLAERLPNTALLAVTSPDRLHAGWSEARRRRADGEVSALSHADHLLADLPRGAGLVTVLDGHPATLSWLGSVRRHALHPLGVERFGQSADLTDLYRLHGLDADAIVSAAHEVLAHRRDG